jgi:hypothetical protein
MVSKSSLAPALNYEYQLLLKGVDLCQFNLIKQYHDADSKKLPPLSVRACVEELVEAHSKRPLDVAVTNEYKILSGLEFIPSTKCKSAPEIN